MHLLINLLYFKISYIIYNYFIKKGGFNFAGLS
jgi:hypothetical protein